MDHQKKPVKKLSLNKETIRNISEQGHPNMKVPTTSPRCTELNCPTDLCG